MKTILVAVGSACFLLGVVVGTFGPGIRKGIKQEVQVQHRDHAAFHARDATGLRAPGKRRVHGSPATGGAMEARGSMDSQGLSKAKVPTLEGVSGLADPGRDGPLVVVSADLIKHLSQAARGRSLDQDLFAGGAELLTNLQITDVEHKRMESEWEAFRGKIRSLEKKSATFEEKPDGSLEIVLSGSNSQIGRIRDGFRHSAQAIIGDNRTEILFAAAQIDGMLEELGHERKMVVRVEESGGGDWRYHAVVEGPHGKRTYVGENVPQSIRDLTGELRITSNE